MKLQTLRTELETLQMKTIETVQNFFSRVVGDINQIRVYDDNIFYQTIIEKILRSLIPRFDHVVAVIEVSKDLIKLTIDELSSLLQEHESRLN